MPEKKKLPVGIDNFEKIIKKLNKNMRGGDSTDGKLSESGKQRFFEYEK